MKPSEVVSMPMTSVNVDAELLLAAKRVLGVRTNREAINLALGEIAKRDRLLQAVKRIAAMDFEPNAQKIHYDLPSPTADVHA